MESGQTESRRPAARVVVADDDHSVAELLRRVLEKEGYGVEVVHDGVSAVEAVRQHKPHVAICDVNMPGMTGLDVCRQLKADAATRLTPVVLVTGMAQREKRIEGLEAGADDFLTKPVERQELQARIRAGQRILDLERSLEDKIASLEKALGRVRALEGLISICMQCKRIRSGPDQWTAVEHYIEAHSSALFTHALCESCLEAHYQAAPAAGQK